MYAALQILLLYFNMHVQISMNVRTATHVVSMQTVMILMAVTGVSAEQDSREMDTTAQVSYVQFNIWTASISSHAYCRH